jgi:hypothetical protein
MSYEAWGDGDDGLDSFTSERTLDIGMECFRKGAQVCREMMARFVEQGGDTITAGSIRANWNPEWGVDPGQVSDEEYESIRTGFDPWICAS